MASKAPAWYQRPADVARHGWMILCEAGNGFVHNSDFRQASSLAFYSTITLLPTLLLLTFLLSLGIGSSLAALEKTSVLIHQVVPQFGDVILREVHALAYYPRTAGTLNVLVLAWTLTPLVGSLREILEGMFKIHLERPLITGKLMDLVIGVSFITGLAGVAGAGVLVDFLTGSSGGIRLSAWLGFTLLFSVTVALVWGVFAFFTTRVHPLHLLTGAFATAVLWFLASSGRCWRRWHGVCGTTLPGGRRLEIDVPDEVAGISPRVLPEIVLVILFGLPPRTGGGDLGDDGLAPLLRRQGLHLLGGAPLLLAVVEDGTAVG
jgi:uncharacterized BrkB/YihY/UPF0761 family membrane protein